MRVLVCGGRNFRGDDAWNAVIDALERIHAATPITAIIQGGATGADSLGSSWAIMRGLKDIHVPANWHEHGKAAGPIRNQRMIDAFRPDLVVAFPGGRGTADMVARAKAAGLRVIEPCSPLTPRGD